MKKKWLKLKITVWENIEIRREFGVEASIKSLSFLLLFLFWFICKLNSRLYRNINVPFLNFEVFFSS